MKILLNENQYNMVLEITENVDGFTNKVLEKFFIDNCDGDYKEFKNLFINSIEKSGCKKIQFGNFNLPALGLALHDRVVISNKVLNEKMGMLIYVIFHEIAHQYQYNKYGYNKMYELYINKIPANDAIEFLRYSENVADDYGMRKAREFAKYGFIKLEDIPTEKAYEKATDSQLIFLIQMMKQMVGNNTSNDDISAALYNRIISKI